MVTEDGVILCSNGISEKFRRIGNRYNIKTVFKTKKASSLLFKRTPQNRILLPEQRSRVCRYKKCVITYVELALGEKEELRRRLEANPRWRTVFQWDHKIRWDDVTTPHIEQVTKCGKYKEVAHVAVTKRPIVHVSTVFCQKYSKGKQATSCPDPHKRLYNETRHLHISFCSAVSFFISFPSYRSSTRKFIL
jgi:hypothetical protein